MEIIDEAIKQAVASLNIDNLNLNKEQIEKIKECLVNDNEGKLIDDLINISSEKEKKHEK